MVKKISRWLRAAVAIFLLILLATGSVPDPANQIDRVRTYSRPFEFDYLAWMSHAMWNKFEQFTLGADRYVPSAEGDPDSGSQLVIEYLELVNEVFRLENSLEEIYSDPKITDPDQVAEEVKAELAGKRAKRQNLAPLVEDVFQRQINATLSDVGLTLGGQAIPPVLYQSVHKSYALIISPRDEIRSDVNRMLIPDLTLEEIEALEEVLEANLDVSALVVRIGGLGTYPAMIVEGGGVPWLAHVVTHEWVHNYLTIRPLGMHYYASPAMMAINETVADLVSYEVRDAVLARFYPEYVPAPAITTGNEVYSETEKFIIAFSEMRREYLFDFRHEMHKTRVVVDRMLAEGQIEEAENYMEERREFFWEHGYHIRKLNQAYFAFHGSYAALPGGAVSGGTNTLGNNIRNLREELPSLSAFVRKAAWMWTPEQFKQAFEEYLSHP